MANYVFGVDIGGTTVKIGLFTTQGVWLRNGRSQQEQMKVENIS